MILKNDFYDFQVEMMKGTWDIEHFCNAESEAILEVVSLITDAARDFTE